MPAQGTDEAPAFPRASPLFSEHSQDGWRMGTNTSKAGKRAAAVVTTHG